MLNENIMLNQEIVTQRLTHIKQLYRIGCEQSFQVESIAVFSLLAFHDSIEMFLKLLSEHQEINSSKFNFLDYWDAIPNLTLKESMRNLNSRRVNLKHKGLLPAKSEIEISRINTTDFFEQNTVTQFGVQFNEISLVNLVVYPEVKKFLKIAEECLSNNDSEQCIANVACAFNELITTYENNKSHFYGQSPFFFGEDLSFHNSFFLKISDDTLAGFVDKVKESIEAIRDAIKITSFGIDYEKFTKFKILTPSVLRTMDGTMHLQFWRNKKINKTNCQFCIDFVIYAAMTLQEFDFDIDSLEVGE